MQVFSTRGQCVARQMRAAVFAADTETESDTGAEINQEQTRITAAAWKTTQNEPTNVKPTALISL